MNLSVKAKLLIWVSVTLFIAVSLLIAKYWRHKPFPAGDQWLGLALSTSGMLIGAQNIYLALANQQLQKLLDLDGCIALVIGGACAIWLGGKEITKLFVERSSIPPP